MAKFQFFQQEIDGSKTTTYLDMRSESFIEEKEQLISAGFEVVGDVIDAPSAEDANQKFKMGFITPVGDYTNATVEGGAATFVIESYKAIRKKLFH
ncbi:hypothetical protein VST7929_03072 [Vibrio stylophorae]|uniref:Uncharacterized protein n=1 Tax=Vibrio stylophorae TaxID=659351 RepID=A0ABN8E1Y1_9VIBR|nr:hypothetical protein [Vibrio stylophorae]CAH0535502.1 hypothetical protein VST7929_03072 [Vibrio stylophorae]